MTVTLSPQTEARARRLADREGKSLDSLVNELLEEVLDLPGVLDDDASARLALSNQAVEKAGKSLSTYLAEQRDKYGYGKDWPGDSAATEIEPGVFIPTDK